ncbi:MAG: hypothetical protein EA376_01705 [Phycisphaeraceae bacterium]|nr:MAG: hypothetical protein EA376_01705 [Phycisphaeraceae bacterium]
MSILSRCAIGMGTLLAVSAGAAATPGFQFNLLLQQGDALPDLGANLTSIRHVSLNNNGEFIFGGLSDASADRDFIYRGNINTLDLDLLARRGGMIPGADPALTHGLFRAAVGINNAGDTTFATRHLPGNLDTIHLNGARFLGNPDTVDGDQIGLIFHSQVDGMGNPWAVIGLGANTATNRALIRGSDVILRKGSMVDGINIVDISTSEASAGSKLRVNDAGDYIVEINGNTGAANHRSLIFNGSEIQRQGASFLGGVVDFIDHTGVTENGNAWYTVTLDGFSGPRFLVYDGNVLGGTGDDLGNGLTLDRMQIATANSNGDWMASASILGADADSDRALIFNGKIVAQKGDAAFPGFLWNDFGFLRDLQLNDAGEFIFSGSLIPEGGGSAVNVLVSGVIPTPGAVSLFALAGLAAVRRRRN